MEIPVTDNAPCQNTDREIYRGPSRAEWGDDDRYYADSIHVTEGGGIGINCGGYVIVKPLRDWHALAQAVDARVVARHDTLKDIRGTAHAAMCIAGLAPAGVLYKLEAIVSMADAALRDDALNEHHHVCTPEERDRCTHMRCDVQCRAERRKPVEPPKMDVRTPEWHRVGERMPLAHMTVALAVRMDGGMDFRTGFMDEGGDWYCHPTEKLEPGDVTHWQALRYPPRAEVDSAPDGHRP